jgi:hypothetical protein
MLKKLLFGMTAAGAGMLALGGVAFAAGAPQPSAAYQSGAVVARTGGSSAVVRVAYSCTTGVSPVNHLFVAVKQGPNESPQNPTADDSTTAFLSTNWNADNGPNALNCDGQRHLQQIVVKPQPGTNYGPLTDGPALVQICLYDNITSFDPYPVGGFASSYTMEHVVVSHAP